MLCAGDIGGHRTILGRWHPPCAELPGPWRAVLGKPRLHADPRPREGTGGRDRVDDARHPFGSPLLVTHVPLTEVPDGCVNVHGHGHAFKPLRRGRWINVSVEQTLYRPLDVRTQIIPLAKALVARRIPPGLTTAERVRHARLAVV